MSMINLISSAAGAFAQWRRRQKAYSELMALDDRSLSDIGIHRSQIAGLVEGAHKGGDVAEPVATVPARGFALRDTKLAGGR